MGFETIDDITIKYMEDEKEVVKEIDKVILSRGSWTTIMFKYQDFDRKKEDFGPVKVSIRRYQKTSGEFRQRSKFNISSAKQANQIIGTLQTWFKDLKEESGEEADD